MFTGVLLLTLNLKTKKKKLTIRFYACNCDLNMENFEERIFIFAIFCFITSKKGRKQLKQGKSYVEFTEISSKNASARTGSSDSMMVIFQSKTLIASVGLPRLTTMK